MGRVLPGGVAEPPLRFRARAVHVTSLPIDPGAERWVGSSQPEDVIPYMRGIAGQIAAPRHLPDQRAVERMTDAGPRPGDPTDQERGAEDVSLSATGA